ncbi:MAG: butyrate kinase [candidate division Zixibacteria bacterium]|nr:butyrate kinase [candidate division Zixibacteria bacterium]
MSDYIVVINPGSTSTKVSLFEGEKIVSEENFRLDAAELTRYDNVADQFDYRMQPINRWLEACRVKAGEVKAVVGRGAPLKPLEGGSYEINDQILDDIRNRRYSNHASNLGAIIARHLGERFAAPSLIADPITVDNFTDLARVSGFPEIVRRCRAHTLNIRAVARRIAAGEGKKLEEVNFVVVHMGGGISVAALEGGRVVDVNDGLLGMGPFSPDRAGALPIGALVKLCYSGKYSEVELVDRLSRKAGLQAYLGTNDLREVENMIAGGDEKALLYFNAMAYQIAKEAGCAAVVLKGNFESIILTGGMANSKRLVEEIKKYISFLGKVVVVPGEFEMEALATAGMRYLKGEEILKKY